MHVPEGRFHWQKQSDLLQNITAGLLQTKNSINPNQEEMKQRDQLANSWIVKIKNSEG